VDGLKCIVTIHDLIFLRYPEYYPAIDRKIYEYKFRKACITADIVVAVSECTKRDIVKFFDINPEKIKVVYQGCDKSFQTKADESVSEEARTTYNLPKEYILYVGSIESRKNLMLIVKAMKHIKSDLPLVAVGKSTPYADKVKRYIKENGLSDKVRILHNVSFKHLPSVYQMSSLFIYPSFFEGFGIPILEALYSGVPVIAATGSCLEEAGGPSSIYVNPTDEQSLATAIDSVLTDDVLRNKMIKDGLYYAQRFDQKKLSEDMMKLYESLLK
jgi:glycosyltransferase involved in cell wall biosynthesis